jgi:hypothetical protein
MPLSNAERQRRYIERLKARAATGDPDTPHDRLMKATLDLAVALAETRELDEGCEHGESIEGYRDKVMALLPLVTQFRDWVVAAADSTFQVLQDELKADTDRWRKQEEDEYSTSMELPPERLAVLCDRIREAFDTDEERGRALSILTDLAR